MSAIGFTSSIEPATLVARQLLHGSIDLNQSGKTYFSKPEMVFMDFRELIINVCFRSSRRHYFTGTRCFSSSSQFKTTWI
jgi:hypothetical protein